METAFYSSVEVNCRWAPRFDRSVGVVFTWDDRVKNVRCRRRENWDEQACNHGVDELVVELCVEVG